MTMTAKIANTSNYANEYLRIIYKDGRRHELAPGEYISPGPEYEGSIKSNPPGIEGIADMEFFKKEGVEDKYVGDEDPCAATSINKAGFRMHTSFPIEPAAEAPAEGPPDNTEDDKPAGELSTSAER